MAEWCGGRVASTVYDLQVATSSPQDEASWFSVNTLGDVITAVGILAFASPIADLTWTPTHILYGVTAVVGGALIEGGPALGISAMSFRSRGVRDDGMAGTGRRRDLVRARLPGVAAPAAELREHGQLSRRADRTARLVVWLS